MLRIIVCMGLILGIAAMAMGQDNANSLRKKRIELEQKLKQSNHKLTAVRAKRGAAVDEAAILRQRIGQRTELLATLQKETSQYVRRMQRDSIGIKSLNEDLDRMKREYAATCRVANRARLSRGWLSFLLSADGFNEAFRRMLYIRQYQAYRSRQAVLIAQTKQTLEDGLKRLKHQRILQDSLLAEAENQKLMLVAELDVQQDVLKGLKNSEKEILSKIAEYRERTERLQREIQLAISREVEKAHESTIQAKSAERKRPNSDVTDKSASITRLKGQLGWPVVGHVVRKFGRQPHPDVPSVTIKNLGIDISSKANQTVEAIYTGKVISNQQIPGSGYMVMLRHGKYFTVYSNMSKALVKVGSNVNAGTVIGYTAHDKSPLHFELWRGKKALNPMRWLAH